MLTSTADARSPDAAEVEAAIAGVLEAERAAGAAVESCAARAQARVQQARERLALYEHADPDAGDLQRLQAAIERLAASLTADERGGAR